MTEKKKYDFYWFIETNDAQVMMSLYYTLHEMNLAVETADVPHPDNPQKRLYLVEVKYKLITLLRTKEIDLKKAGARTYHVWRKKGRDGKLVLLDDIFKRKLSAKAREAQKRAEELKKQFPYDPSKKPLPPNVPKKY